MILFCFLNMTRDIDFQFSLVSYYSDFNCWLHGIRFLVKLLKWMGIYPAQMRKPFQVDPKFNDKWIKHNVRRNLYIQSFVLLFEKVVRISKDYPQKSLITLRKPMEKVFYFLSVLLNSVESVNKMNIIHFKLSYFCPKFCIPLRI